MENIHPIVMKHHWLIKTHQADIESLLNKDMSRHTFLAMANKTINNLEKINDDCNYLKDNQIITDKLELMALNTEQEEIEMHLNSIQYLRDIIKSNQNIYCIKPEENNYIFSNQKSDFMRFILEEIYSKMTYSSIEKVTKIEDLFTICDEADVDVFLIKAGE
ncbi:MAG: hypothetical protein E6618_12500 [Staphylococcus warneri]|nr:hypothetical protein [Staphylococcus warneri]